MPRNHPLRVYVSPAVQTTGRGIALVVLTEHFPKMDNSHVITSLRADQARALAEDLNRAADEAERTEGEMPDVDQAQ